MPSFVLTGTSIPNPSPPAPTNGSSVPHHQDHTLVNNEVAAIGGYFNVSAARWGSDATAARMRRDYCRAYRPLKGHCHAPS